VQFAAMGDPELPGSYSGGVVLLNRDCSLVGEIEQTANAQAIMVLAAALIATDEDARQRVLFKADQRDSMKAAQQMLTVMGTMLSRPCKVDGVDAVGAGGEAA
jgi:hypothetical protein